MKLLALLSYLVILAPLAAKENSSPKVNMREFSKELNKEIRHRVNQNPHTYETKPIMRAPASVEQNTPELEETPVEKLERFRHIR